MLHRTDHQESPSFMLRIMLFIFSVLRFFTGTRTETNVPKHRKLIERLARLLPHYKGATNTAFNIDGMPAEWIKPYKADPKKVLYYLHGGAYAVCSINTHRRMIGKIASRAGVIALAIEYRMAPEDLFPAAVDDAVKGYQYLLDQGFEASDIVIGGDSAGGGLSVALMVKLKDMGLPLPKTAILLSPWTDLEGIGESNTKYDIPSSIINNKALVYHGKLYAGKEDVQNPLISPIYADLSGLPPFLVTASRTELIYNDSTRLVEKAVNDGDEVTFITYPNPMHVWQVFDFLLPEARRSIAELGDYIKTSLA